MFLFLGVGINEVSWLQIYLHLILGKTYTSLNVKPFLQTVHLWTWGQQLAKYC